VSVCSASRQRMHLLTLSFEIGVQISSVAQIAVERCAVFATSAGTLEFPGNCAEKTDVFVLMRVARNPEIGGRSSGISVYVPRLPSSPHVSADSSAFAAELGAGAQSSYVKEAFTQSRHVDAGGAQGQRNNEVNAVGVQNRGVPSQLLSPTVIDAATSDTPTEHTRALSPLAVLRTSPRRNSPPRQSSPPLRDAGGTVYHRPLQTQTLIAPSENLVYRLQSFLPPAVRPSTRRPTSPLHSATHALKIACDGPALGRFPLSVQGGLTASQVKRAHTPAYEPRILGHEREPLAQTWLVPSAIARGAQKRGRVCFTHNVSYADRIRTPALTFQATEALGWEAFRRVERKDGASDSVPFERCDPKAPLAGYFLQPRCKTELNTPHATTSSSSNTSLSKQVHEVGDGSQASRLPHHVSRSNSLRWGSPSLSAPRSSSATPLPSDARLAIGDKYANSLKQTAPLVVSSFKQALQEWEAAVDPSADPFALINSKSELVTCSPLSTQRRASCDIEGVLPNEDSNADEAAQVRKCGFRVQET
jgi:hypothetical protein